METANLLNLACNLAASALATVFAAWVQARADRRRWSRGGHWN